LTLRREDKDRFSTGYSHPPKVKTILEKIPKAIHTDRVFLQHGKPFDEIKHAFQTACENAGIKDFCFHDLRHCALNNLRKAGNDFF
jgi:integrase